MGLEDWLLSSAERGNPATRIDDAHRAGPARGEQQAWSHGNQVRPLVHGHAYFSELTAAIERAERDDLVLFTDWRGDPDEKLTDSDGDTTSQVLCRAAARGVIVRGLVWRSHLDRFQFSATENRHLGEEIDRAGGCCLLDMRVRTGGSHHQKFVVIRYSTRPELDVAFVGGIDLCHSRRDTAEHAGDRQAQPMAAVYGARPPWHDVQLAIQGPAVADVETVFRERWDDPQPLSRNPIHRLADVVRSDDRRRPLPAPGQPPQPVGPHSVQLLRTYPHRAGGYPFAPNGERSIARGYVKALRRARELIYLEDQYLWSRDVAVRIADAMRDNPGLKLIAVLPMYPDQDGRLSMPPNLVGRAAALRLIRSVAPSRVGVYGIENEAGVPIYVHAKVCVIDDVWATTGSDNFNRRSWTHDSELTVAVWDETRSGRPARSSRALDEPRAYPLALRAALAREHLGPDGDSVDLADPEATFAAFADAAARLEEWSKGDRRSPRPSGQLRPLPEPKVSRLTRAWASPIYRAVYDPDGRALRERWRGHY
ncbi:MAG: phospholipase D family protein [Actinomycetota bacterium]|nr:phospholipase D family protein [Actinomycetota bacterium]